jgi:hypothetical protein
METCDVYIRSVLYENQGWLDDPDSLLEQINNNLSEISHFYFTRLSINMAQVYNVGLKTSNYDSMMLFIKGIKFKQEQYLSFRTTAELIIKITQQLNYIDHFVFGKIEVRNSKQYTDAELGLV